MGETDSAENPPIPFALPHSLSALLDDLRSLPAATVTHARLTGAVERLGPLSMPSRPPLPAAPSGTDAPAGAPRSCDVLHVCGARDAVSEMGAVFLQPSGAGDHGDGLRPSDTR